MASAQRLYGWTTLELEALARLVADAWGQWRADWGAAGGGLPVCLAAQPSDAATDWVACAADGERCAWLQAGAEAAVGHALFGERAETTGAVARQLVAAALADLRASLAACLGLMPAGAASASGLPPLGAWSGSVLIELALPGQALRLIVNAAGVAGLVASAAAPAPPPQAAPPLVPLHSALARQTVRLKVALNPCELDLGELQGLCVGDVLRLPHALDAPAYVTAQDDTPVCEAYLGSHGNRKAIELARTPL